MVRDLPAKPNHPWEDLGDAACYFAGGVAPQLERTRREDDDRRPRQTRATSMLSDWVSWPGRHL